MDTSSSLNVMPKTTLMKLNAKINFMKTSTLVVKAFDGSRRMVIEEVDLPIMVGPHTFMTIFQVMNIHIGYNCILGRPWIHDAGGITLKLYQMLKFIVVTH